VHIHYKTLLTGVYYHAGCRGKLQRFYCCPENHRCYW